MSRYTDYAIVELWPGEPPGHTLGTRQEFAENLLMACNFEEPLSYLQKALGLVIFHHPGFYPPNLACLTLSVDPSSSRTSVHEFLPKAPVLVIIPEYDPVMKARYISLGAIDVVCKDESLDVLAARVMRTLKDVAWREAQARNSWETHQSRLFADKVIDSLVPIEKRSGALLVTQWL